MKKVIVKVGSSVIAQGGKLERSVIKKIVKDILLAKRKGYGVILVTSGAIACGLNQLKSTKKPQDLHSLMALSSLGQIILMDIYENEFKKSKALCAQILLTWDDFDNRQRFLNARACINKLLSLGITPIINENDAVSFEEIRFGDNDRLSALVADLMGAQELIILSDVDGLMEEGKVIDCVATVDEKILKLAKKKGKVFTAGGMQAKLEAVKVATSAGIKAVIANGKLKGVVSSVLSGKKIGTTFLPTREVQQARKRWIAFGKKAKGKIYIDCGAKEAILERGKSLLAVGIIKVEGDFKKKDAVLVLDPQGKICGCGITNYSCDELEGAKTKKLSKEVIHRDNFVNQKDTL